jgi:starch synthase
LDLKQNIAHKRPEFSPSYDNKIFKKFGTQTLEGKTENKLQLQEELGWVKERRTPLLCIPTGMSDTLGGKEFAELVEGILALPCQLIVRGIGSEKYGKLFTRLENEYSHRVKILKDTDEQRRKMYAASDMALFFAPNEEEIVNCMAYGAVPVSGEHTLLMDYNPVQEAGNAFIAHPYTPWTWFAALVRATETFKLPYDWRTIQKHCIESVKED